MIRKTDNPGPATACTIRLPFCRPTEITISSRHATMGIPGIFTILPPRFWGLGMESWCPRVTEHIPTRTAMSTEKSRSPEPRLITFERLPKDPEYSPFVLPLKVTSQWMTRPPCLQRKSLPILQRSHPQQVLPKHQPSQLMRLPKHLLSQPMHRQASRPNLPPTRQRHPPRKILPICLQILPQRRLQQLLPRLPPTPPPSRPLRAIPRLLPKSQPWLRSIHRTAGTFFMSILPPIISPNKRPGKLSASPLTNT
mmetsp:Transcript_5870/g.12084  ORF Transcript_5870/g.12084 Transcript_5870/m.12084 type:complete len:253 (-) Transcript_5870:311-1069(-)